MDRDRIALRGMLFYAYHGNRPEERSLGQPFRVDMEVELDLRAAGASDDLNDTIDYGRLYEVVRDVVEGPPRNLLEAVAESIAHEVIEGFAVTGVRVKVTKLRPPIKGAILEGTSVEVYRTRGQAGPTCTAA